MILNHIALIPDGNRRWAKNKNLPSFEGHKRGYQNFINFCKWCKKRNIQMITAFGFSTENWNRKDKEINYLMKLFEMRLKKNKKDTDIKINIIGNKRKLPISLQKIIREVEKKTKNNKKMVLNIALNYGGKWDITQALKKIIQKGINYRKIDEKLIEKNLLINNNPDLVLRTGKEKRLSNFLIWQSAYSEIVFCDKFWPDFTEKDLDKVIKDYSCRCRRFGK